jgi:hypothetical protein
VRRKAVVAGCISVNLSESFNKSGLGREKELQGIRNYQEMKSLYSSMSSVFAGSFTIAK